jgi:type II secretory pathway pseudopilin PulG|tara:strand:- start:3838 stop:4341 length:504 start_codon:yes stop_codon:yes gene_type:complete
MIELITILVIGSVIMMFGISAASTIAKNGNIEKAKTNVAVMMLAGQSFYEAYCQILPVSNRPSPTTARLVSDEFLSDSRFAQNPWGSNFTVSIDWGTTSSPTLIHVTAQMSGDHSSGKLFRTLEADQVLSGNRARWTETPAVFARKGGENLMRHLRMHFEDDSEVCR